MPLFRSAQFEPEYLKINPRGVVPTLVHAGQTIIESTVICEYLDETFSDCRLMPENVAERALVRQWTKLVDEEDGEKRFRNVSNPIREDLYRSSVANGVGFSFVFGAIAS